jgi:hypothetical protein
VKCIRVVRHMPSLLLREGGWLDISDPAYVSDATHVEDQRVVRCREKEEVTCV